MHMMSRKKVRQEPEKDGSIGNIDDGEKLQEKQETDGGQPVHFVQLFRFATRWDLLMMCIAYLCALVEGVFLIGCTVVHGRIADAFLRTHNTVGNDDFYWRMMEFISLYAVAGVLVCITSWTESYFFQWAAESITANIRMAFVSSVIKQDSSFLDLTNAGSLSSQLNNNIDRIRDGIGEKMGLLTRTFANVAASLTVTFFVDWRLSLVLIGAYPVSVISMAIMPKFLSSTAKNSLKITEESNGIAEEAIMNTKTVASLNGQAAMVEKYSKILERSIRESLKIGLISGFFEGLFCWWMYIVLIFGYWYGITWFHSGLITDSSTIFIIVMTTMVASWSLGMLGPHMLAILKARVSAGIIYEIIDRASNALSHCQIHCYNHRCRGTQAASIRTTVDVISSSAMCHSRIRPGRLLLSEVTRDDIRLFSDLSWSISEGESIALVGHSGCGKSTAISLLSRLCNVSGGTILLNGIDIQRYNIGQLRQIIGIVSQEPALFNGTIQENISLGREINNQNIEESAKLSNAHEFIMKLEKGYDTLLGTGGVSLSGGQKQRIAIARAIVTNPRILLLDEATSALDAHSERIVQNALREACKGRTTVIVAHRLSTIRDVNRIFVLAEGKVPIGHEFTRQVIEQGSYNELITQNGTFAKMVEMQQLETIVSKDDSDSVDSEELPEFVEDHSTARRSHSVRSNREMDVKSEVRSSKGGLWRMMTVDKAKYAFLVIVACIRGLELPMYNYGYLQFFTAIRHVDYADPLMKGICIYGLTGTFVWIMVIASRTTSSWVSEKVLSNVRVSCLSSLLHRSSSYFDRPSTNPSKCAVILSQDIPNSSPPVDYRAALIFENLTTLFGLTIAGVYYCWPNGIVCLTCALLFIALYLFFLRGIKKATDTLAEKDISAEIFGHTKTIQVLRAEEYFLNRFDALQKAGTDARKSRSFHKAGVHMITQTMFFLSQSLATFVCMIFAYRGYVEPEYALASENSVSCMNFCMILMSFTFNDLIASSTPTGRVFSLIDDETMDIRKGQTIEISGSLSVEDVSFAYPSRPHHEAARSISLRVARGQSVALVGPSGSGKSTLIQLLERFYEPSKGTIKLDGHPIDRLSLHNLRSNISLVSQEPVLFTGTIYENITLGADNSTMEDVINACRLANAAEFIEKLPKGYETEVGERGRGLSGGQKQRIAIARAIVRNPKVILMDEAMSALDSESERLVRMALESSSTGRTSVTVTHRLSTIRNANQICFVDDGRIVERGTHEELMRKNGEYAKLAREQNI